MKKIIGNTILDVKEIEQELIDRETPRKPLWDNNGYIKCNTCKLSLVSTNDQLINYCSNCGQKIDWSDE